MVVEKIDRAAQGPVFGAPVLLFRSIVRLFSAGFILEYSIARLETLFHFSRNNLKKGIKISLICRGTGNFERIHFFENCFERKNEDTLTRDEKKNFTINAW